MGAIEDINNLTPKGKALLHKVTEPSQPTIKEQVKAVVKTNSGSDIWLDKAADQIIALITQHLLEELLAKFDKGTLVIFVEGYQGLEGIK